MTRLWRIWRWIQCAFGDHENNHARTHRLAPLFPIRCDHCNELFYANHAFDQ